MPPIEGTTPEEAADRFVRHLNGVLSKTITDCRLRRLRVGDNFQLAFEEEDAPAGQARIATKFGTMWLYIGQVCHTRLVQRKHRLHTREYKYTITREGESEPLFRWEYERYPAKAKAGWCRHHLQGPLELPLQTRRKHLTLNDLHLPTGYVQIEEVIRFCISDLGVRSTRTDWDEILQESSRQFREEFTEFGSV